VVSNSALYRYDKGTFSSPLGECKNSFVSCNDMGEAAVTCFLQGVEKHGDKYYDVTGSQSTSMVGLWGCDT
jgi:hypothetical protein